MAIDRTNFDDPDDERTKALLKLISEHIGVHLRTEPFCRANILEVLNALAVAGAMVCHGTAHGAEPCSVFFLETFASQLNMMQEREVPRGN